MRIQQGSGSHGAFEKAPDANKVPALAVAHSRVGNALEEINILFHIVQEFMWLRVPDLFHAGLLYPQEETVDFPHISELICSRTCRAFSRADAMQDTMDEVLSSSKVSAARNAIGIDFPRGLWCVQAAQEALPAQACISTCLVEHLGQMYIDEARCVSAVQVAAHPVETFGDSRKHGLNCELDLCSRSRGDLPDPLSLSLHLARSSPPTSPRLRATRARPPGSTVSMPAKEHKGAEIDMARFNLTIKMRRARAKGPALAARCSCGGSAITCWRRLAASGGAVWTDQHAIPAGFSNCFDYEFFKVFKHIFLLLFVAQQ